MSTAVAEKKPMSAQLVEFKHQLDVRSGEFESALPAHIPVERFMRVVLTAVQNAPDLITKVNRRSLFNAAVKAAQDGLLPDGREGAIVPYKEEAQWLPMIAGIRKKVRNSGEIATWDVVAVYEKDHFKYRLGDEPFIEHEPYMGGDPGKVIAAYSIAVMKNGEKSRDVMPVWQIERVRTKSRGTNTPWNDPVFYPEMCKKTVARRHSKSLPMSTDLDDLIRRDDNLYDMEGASDRALEQRRPRSLDERLNSLVTGSHETIDHDPETGEVRDDARGDGGAQQNAAPARAKRQSSKQSESARQEKEVPPGDGKAAGDAGKDASSGKPPTGDAAPPAAETDAGDRDDNGGGDRDADAAPAREDRVEKAAKLGREAGMLGKMKRTIPAEYGTKDAAAEGREDEWKAWMDAHAAATRSEG